MLLSASGEWAATLGRTIAIAERAADYLAEDDIYNLTFSLLVGSTICRRLLEEAREGSKAIEGDCYHFAAELVERLILLDGQSGTLNMKGCWRIDKKDGTFLQDADFSLDYYSVFSQIVHCSPLQFHKSLDERNPDFQVASKVHNEDKHRFYRIFWKDFAEILHHFQRALLGN